MPLVALEEANFLNARDLAVRHGWLDVVMGPMRGLQILYEYTGRDLETARLAEELAPLLTEPSTGLPPSELEQDFLILTEIRSRAARRARNWELAERLLRTSLQVSERRAEAARAMPAPDRNTIRSLAVDYLHVGLALNEQERPECGEYYEKALAIFEEIGDSPGMARAAGNLANVYLEIPELLDFDLAEKWLLMAIEHYGEDRIGQSICLVQLAGVKRDRIRHLFETGAGQEAIGRAWHGAADSLNEAFRLLPGEAARELSVAHDVAGDLYRMTGEIDRAMSHYQQRIRLDEQLGQQYAAGAGRLKAAETLAQASRFDDAALFAERAIQDFNRSEGLGLAASARQLLDRIRTEQSKG
jgi:tetratricopeptide (TPR) repeat protein